MKRFFLLFLFFTTNLFAQKVSPFQNESNQLELLCNTYSNNSDSLLYYGNKLLEIGKENRYVKGIVEGYFALGRAASMTKNQDAFIVYLDSALLYEEEITENHFSHFAKIMRHKAIAYTKKGDKVVSEEILKETIATCLKTDKMQDAALLYNSFGELENERGNFGAALKYFDSALDIWHTNDVENPKSGIFLNIGKTQVHLFHYNQAISSFHHGLSIAKAHDNKRDEYRFYNNLATAFIAKNENDSASFYLQKTIPYYLQNRNISDLNLAFMSLGHVKLNQKESDSAFYYLMKSLKGLKFSQNIKLVSQNYRCIAKAHYLSKNYEKALRYLDSANTLSIKHNLQTNFNKEHDLYAKIHEANGEYQKAIHNLKQKDSLLKKQYLAETGKGYYEILVEQKVQHKDDAISMLKNQKSFYRSNLFLSLLLICILIGIAFSYFKKHKVQKTEVTQLQNELDSQNSRFEDTQKPEPIAVLKLKSKVILKTCEILYSKSDGHYVEIFHEGIEKPEIERMSLTNLLELLPKADFIRIHKSYLVNLHKIKIVNATEIMLEDGTWINLSRTYKLELKEKLNNK